MSRVLVLLCLLGLVGGCAPQRTECDDVVDEARSVVVACGADLGDYDGGQGVECTEALLSYDECFLGCFKAAPCDAFTGKNQSALGSLAGCQEQCINAQQ